MLNLDTHILLYALNGTLRAKEAEVLGSDRWGISAIVLWEIQMLHSLGRIAHALDSAPVARALDSIHIWQIDREVCLSIAQLDFESDPADEMIAATSLVHGVPLVTRGKRLRSSQVVQILP